MNALVKTNKRVRGGYGHLDLLKLVLVYAVLLRHFTQSYLPEDSFLSWLIVCVISPIAVPAFFMASGFLLQDGSSEVH